MALIPISNMVIGDLAPFDWSSEIEVVSGWEKFTDTSTITLPSNLQIDRNKLKSLIKSSDPVSIDLGYAQPDGDGLQNVFNGFVTGLKPSIPIVISCEDEMRKLKENRITDKISGGSLKTLMEKHFSQWNPRFIDAQLGGQFIIENQTHAQVLQYLKEKFGLFSFFRGGRLIVGYIYDPETAVEHTFEFGNNVIDENGLEYMRKEDVRLEVTAVSILPDGSRIEEKIGDAGGEQRTLTFYDVPKSELKAVAQRELDRLKYDGFRGDFKAFGLPKVNHGDVVRLIDRQESDREGRYWIDEVTYTFGMGGYQQKIKLGPAA